MQRPLARVIGSAARQARRELQITQQHTADQLDVSVEFYGRIERGIALPSIHTFTKMLTVLGVSADRLLGRDGTATAANDSAPAEAPAVAPTATPTATPMPTDASAPAEASATEPLTAASSGA